MNIGTLAIIGSLLAGLLSVPATGATITGDIAAAGATLTGTTNTSFQDTPRTVTQQTSPDEMVRTIETAFGTVTIRSTGDTFSADLETPQHDVSVEQEPGKRVMSLTGDGVALDVDHARRHRDNGDGRRRHDRRVLRREPGNGGSPVRRRP
ncbi:MAG: hypothetical protein ABEI97_04515 [Candidatus Nanohaloarchaea archaeon]